MSGPSRALVTSLLVCLPMAPGTSAHYRFDPFTTSHGLPRNTVSAVLQTQDGSPRIATHDGRVRGDGVNHAVGGGVSYVGQGPPPSVVIESVIVDGTPVPFEGGVRVDPGQRDIEINYAASGTSAAEQIRFRYTLEGLNDGWVDAGTRRALHYSYLAPGSYTFRIQAADGDGRWSDGAAAVWLSVRPAFYQTLWFRGLVLLAVAAIGGAVSTLRVRRLQEAERRLTVRIGEATAELASANRRLEQLATVDALTQLANRRRFSEVLDHEWQRASREGASIALLMLDVDCFKRYNDTYGHQAGDACLQRVGAVLAARVRRPSDLAARYGGEEFAVVLPGADEAGAMAVGEWIRAEVERQGIPHGASLAGAVVTVSVGAAVATPAPGMDAASLVAAADAALYRAKERGRNTVIAGMMDTSLDAGAAATSVPRMRIHHPGS